MKSVAHRALVAAAFCGLAGVPVLANAAPMRFDCDSMSGAYSEIAQVQNGPIYAIRADIAPKRLGQHRDWRPSGLIQIKSADGKNSVGVQIVAGARNAALSVSLIMSKDSEQKQYMITTVKLGETIHTSIDVKDSSARVEVAGQVADIPLQLGTNAEVRVGCSTGQFMFAKLEMAAGN